MKRLLLKLIPFRRFIFMALAKGLDRLKIKHPAVYSTVMASLLGINMVITDPEVAALINESVDGDHWLINGIRIFSLFFAAVVNPRTNRFIQQEQGKTMTPSWDPDQHKNGVAGKKAKRKFLGL